MQSALGAQGDAVGIVGIGGTLHDAGDLTKLLYDKGMDAHFTEACIAHIADKSYSAKYGARNMRRFIQTEIEDKIAAELIAARGLLSEITVDCVDDTLRITAE